MVPFLDFHSKVSFDVIWASECVLWTDSCPKRVANGAPKGVQNELKTRVPTKTTKMLFGILFATFQPCQTSFITSISGTDLGHLGGVRREVQKRTPPKHTTPVEGPKGDFLASESLPFSGKILQDGVLEDTP